MPIYEYECGKCGKMMDVLQKISDPPLAHCQYCGGSVRKVLSQTTFHLKGGGWYVTDYGSKKSPSPPSSCSNKTATPPPASSGGDSGNSSSPD